MKPSTIHLITGGQRSGKSLYAERIALEISKYPTYLATSRIWDEGLKKRIEVHKARRSFHWTTWEEEINISHVVSESGVVLLECISSWLTNIYYEQGYNKEKTIAFAKFEWNRLLDRGYTLIVVSNEIGMGQVPLDKQAREFIDVQGELNQYIAKDADLVTLIVSGLPLTIKREHVDI